LWDLYAQTWEPETLKTADNPVSLGLPEWGNCLKNRRIGPFCLAGQFYLSPGKDPENSARPQDPFYLLGVFVKVKVVRRLH